MRARFWLSATVIAIAGSGYSQLNAVKDALPLKKDAIFVLPAEQASGYQVDSSDWSSDGRYLLICRRAMDIATKDFETLFSGSDADQNVIQHEIAIYSAITGKTKVLTQVADPNVIEYTQWIPGTSSAVVQTRIVEGNQVRRTLSLISATGGPSGVLVPDLRAGMNGLGQSDRFRYLWFPDSSASVPGSTVIRFINDKGLLPGAATIPASGGILIDLGVGNGLYYLTRSQGRRDPGGWRVDPATGSVERVETVPPRAARVPRVEDLSLGYTQVKIEGSTDPNSAAVVQLSANDSHKSIVISTDGETPELSPHATAVSYRSRGALIVRRIVHVSLDYYNGRLKLALRERAVNEAKQVALSIIMFAADYDGKYPANDGKWKDGIGPYLRSPELASTFNYTLPGGNANSMPNPASTQLGYVDGPDGRAIAYADGHVVYVANP
jgi:hypothetical protein